MAEMTSYDPGIPSWVDVSSRDLPATVAFYTSLFGWDSFEPPGGTVLGGPFDVMGAGRMGVFMDDGGAVFSVWQPGDHKGAQVVNEPNSLSWNELASSDIEKSKTFYNKVFGWSSETNSMGDMTYTEFKVGDRSIAGMMALGPMHPPGTPPHWLVYFAVADTDATMARAAGLGGKALSPAVDIPIGRFAVMADARGVVFAVIALAPS